MVEQILRLPLPNVASSCPTELLDVTYPANCIVFGTWGQIEGSRAKFEFLGVNKCRTSKWSCTGSSTGSYKWS